jgi:hypothetical protein
LLYRHISSLYSALSTGEILKAVDNAGFSSFIPKAREEEKTFFLFHIMEMCTQKDFLSTLLNAQIFIIFSFSHGIFIVHINFLYFFISILVFLYFYHVSFANFEAEKSL